MEKSSQEGSCCTNLSRDGGGAGAGSSSEPLRLGFFFECFGDDDAILSLFLFLPLLHERGFFKFTVGYNFYLFQFSLF
jgi:hypothetical protein